MNLLHPQLDATTFAFDGALLDEIRDAYRRELSTVLENPQNQYLFKGGRSHRARIGPTGSYFVQSYESYPLLWVSNNDAETHAMFRRFFDRLAMEGEIRKRIDCRERVVMYCGFLVVGDRAPAAQWHNDYAPGAPAYTLITPLFDLEPEHGHLLYEVGEETRRYEYRLNEAIFFGEKTAHSTEPYAPSSKKRVLLSLTFGTDKLEYWPQLRESLESQAPYFILPCGHVYGDCGCLRSSLWERLGRWAHDRFAPVSHIPS